jgi:NADH/NAD ratio-sensing transcriptional regulator Rex
MLFSDRWIKSSYFTLQGERGTGYGVALLLSLFGSSSDNPLLNSVAPSVGQ